MIKAKSNHQVKIKKNKCKGCELCIEFCPTKHLKLSSTLNKKGVKFTQVKKNTTCIGCGFCFYICPDSCIEVYQLSDK